jgi:hypothetical protein
MMTSLLLSLMTSLQTAEEEVVVESGGGVWQTRRQSSGATLGTPSFEARVGLSTICVV